MRAFLAPLGSANQSAKALRGAWNLFGVNNPTPVTAARARPRPRGKRRRKRWSTDAHKTPNAEGGTRTQPRTSPVHRMLNGPKPGADRPGQPAPQPRRRRAGSGRPRRGRPRRASPQSKSARPRRHDAGARCITSDTADFLCRVRTQASRAVPLRDPSTRYTIVREFLHRRPQCQPEPQGAWLPSSGQPVGWIWPVLCWRFHRSTVYESGYGMPSDWKKLQWN